jgi:hypothetical protein
VVWGYHPATGVATVLPAQLAQFLFLSESGSVEVSERNVCLTNLTGCVLATYNIHEGINKLSSLAWLFTSIDNLRHSCFHFVNEGFQREREKVVES